MSYYYEIHVTIGFPGEEHIESLKELASVNGFHMGDLLLMKNEEERSRRDLFFTGRVEIEDIILNPGRISRLTDHAKNVALARAVSMMDLFCRQLDLTGYKILRYKIEDAIVDSRIEDTLNMLS